MIRFLGLFGFLLIAILSGASLVMASSPNRETVDSENQIYIPIILNKPGPGSSIAPQVNVPHFESRVRFPETAILWFGQVDPTNNYADVRIGYNDEELAVRLAVFDRRLWVDQSPTLDTLTDYDGVSLYLNLDGPVGSGPAPGAFRFISQLNWWQPREPWQASFRGASSGWVHADIPFTTNRNWQGNAPNDDINDRGWTMTIRIPFASLGLSGPPPQGTEWGLSVVVHDRDDQAGTPIPDQVWPPGAASTAPATWGSLSFGLPVYTPPQVNPGGSTVIRHGLNGAVVVDAHVGGHSNCGKPYFPNFFEGWGDANFAGYDQVNVQNQYDVSDWPCFSKVYITFPLDQIPADKVLLDANLTLFQIGNAGMGWEPPPEPSLIQVHTILEDWDESTITWNNAPLSYENVARTWVYPIESIPSGPGVPNEWDLTAAAARAYAARQPLRLVLYSADNAYHSGRYFLSSDALGWGGTGRPTLTITWGDP
jgi:hypothetical protein